MSFLLRSLTCGSFLLSGEVLLAANAVILSTAIERTISVKIGAETKVLTLVPENVIVLEVDEVEGVAITEPSIAHANTLTEITICPAVQQYGPRFSQRSKMFE